MSIRNQNVVVTKVIREGMAVSSVKVFDRLCSCEIR